LDIRSLPNILKTQRRVNVIGKIHQWLHNSLSFAIGKDDKQSISVRAEPRLFQQRYAFFKESLIEDRPINEPF
jgi:hypothetical protein